MISSCPASSTGSHVPDRVSKTSPSSIRSSVTRAKAVQVKESRRVPVSFAREAARDTLRTAISRPVDAAARSAARSNGSTEWRVVSPRSNSRASRSNARVSLAVGMANRIVTENRASPSGASEIRIVVVGGSSWTGAVAAAAVALPPSTRPKTRATTSGPRTTTGRMLSTGWPGKKTLSKDPTPIGPRSPDAWVFVPPPGKAR